MSLWMPSLLCLKFSYNSSPGIVVDFVRSNFYYFLISIYRIIWMSYLKQDIKYLSAFRCQFNVSLGHCGGTDVPRSLFIHMDILFGRWHIYAVMMVQTRGPALGFLLDVLICMDHDLNPWFEVGSLSSSLGFLATCRSWIRTSVKYT